MNREPVIIGAIAAAIGLLVAFGVDLGAEQKDAILDFAGAVIALGGIVFARQKVTPVP